MAAPKPRRKLLGRPWPQGGRVRSVRPDPARYAVRTRPSLGLCVIWDDSYGERVWQQARGKNRQDQPCVMCGRVIPRDTDRLWRAREAVQRHKGLRACSACVTKGATFLHA